MFLARYPGTCRARITAHAKNQILGCKQLVATLAALVATGTNSPTTPQALSCQMSTGVQGPRSRNCDDEEAEEYSCLIIYCAAGAKHHRLNVDCTEEVPEHLESLEMPGAMDRVRVDLALCRRPSARNLRKTH
ncbi:hypothetical protein DdX_15494 [Ditylenchus destructor]|uniref:Uncharacterized protein n=1 Tax=Ditylenchus destructor TaxID=166010 RepID=A0AAD4MRB4_9BILA|nr:hypothetical protein DdX_15494 [Ditylenchus destructor]